MIIELSEPYSEGYVGEIFGVRLAEKSVSVAQEYLHSDEYWHRLEIDKMVVFHHDYTIKPLFN